MEMAYYPGCSLKQSSSPYDVQSRRIFSELGVELIEIEDWNCCGATSAGKIDDFMAAAMPARNIGIAESQGFSEIVIPCSACYSRTLMAKKRLDEDPELKAEINGELSHKIKGSLKVSSILEVLINRIDAGEFTSKITHKFTNLKPVCYYGCMQTRFPDKLPVSDNVENPQAMETILKALGVRAIDWNYKTSCCGASAAVNDQEMAFDLMAKIAGDALERGANCLVTTCPMCQLNFDAHQNAFCEKHGIKDRLPIFFITEIIGAAMGISPEEIHADRRFVDGMDLLKELEQNERKEK